MNGTLDELYLNWLYEQIAPAGRSTFWDLARCLYRKEFIWFVPNDDNRCGDGIDLRYEFIEALGLEDVDPDWMELGCSMLELILGLARRLSFQAEGEPRAWFWHLLDNLGLRSLTDRSRFNPSSVDEVLDKVITRTYEPDGLGGLFPLQNPRLDQRHVELWYQLSAYLAERE